MRVQNNDSQSFGLGKLEVPNTEIGKRIDNLRPQIIQLGDELTSLHVSSHEPHEYGFHVERPLTPYKDTYENTIQTSFLYAPIPMEEMPKDDVGLINLIKDILLTAQTRMIKEYQKASTTFVEGLKKFTKENCD